MVWTPSTSDPACAHNTDTSIMTSSTDWPHGVDAMSSIEPTSDLFDGDLLGDELIDIYNAAVVGGSDDDTMNGE